MANYELQSDEVVLLEGMVTSKVYKGRIKVSHEIPWDWRNASLL